MAINGIYKIGHISAIFKDRLLVWTKNSINSCAENFTMFGVIKCISGHVAGH